MKSTYIKVDELHSQMKADQEGLSEPSLFVEHLWRVESVYSFTWKRVERAVNNNLPSVQL